ncbi:MAG: GNAT family N-acetyltransferase [Thermomicrobiales bacterium]
MQFSTQLVPLASQHVQQACSLGQSLAAWFGDDEGLRQMRAALNETVGFVALQGDELVGFITYDVVFPETWEITWLAVAETMHRQGIGRLLVERVAGAAANAGAAMITVKTLADTHPSPEYARTRAFYQALGFSRLAVLPEIWGPANPCLMMARSCPGDSDAEEC